jgi:alkanesulfonate monooxygenase SsuD/methylene tetrahydromethanopterin reductase-like flavin-dependent oxidoreductase (luciferase family)
LGCDGSQFDLDGPCPRSRRATPARAAGSGSSSAPAATNLTVRQLAQIAGGYGGLAMVGTPKMIADQMEEWLLGAACDGFNIMFPWVPGGLDDFVGRVIPELQRRHLLRREYEGRTLRENLGLPRPENRFFEKRGF